jgi:hypothetical protein
LVYLCFEKFCFHFAYLPFLNFYCCSKPELLPNNGNSGGFTNRLFRLTALPNYFAPSIFATFAARATGSLGWQKPSIDAELHETFAEITESFRTLFAISLFIAQDLLS